ncbi:MAG TPA: thioredoxin [Methanomassiliicoccales archaeon]|jgi:thioredoxin 1|nr:thioredoxin [Euryarchaeota archaeon]HOE52506.1 thioredoxin [Methanomassiliicoccales archaeon]HQM66883.1 thioredoxin [Methanomassiliicoccales archaeon]HRR66428.1 thioredoxin [Methanomassiliicoccales archaeon]
MVDDELAEIRRRKLEALMGQNELKGVNGLSGVTEVKDSTFEEFIRSAPLVIIDCWAPWCGPCRMLAPIMEQLAEEYQGKIRFGKLNTDENERTPMRFNITAIPTMLVFKNGMLLDRIVGAGNKDFMRQKFSKYL